MFVNEFFQMIEVIKGINSYYLISDGSIMSYCICICMLSYVYLQ